MQGPPASACEDAASFCAAEPAPLDPLLFSPSCCLDSAADAAGLGCFGGGCEVDSAAAAAAAAAAGAFAPAAPAAGAALDDELLLLPALPELPCCGWGLGGEAGGGGGGGVAAMDGLLGASCSGFPQEPTEFDLEALLIDYGAGPAGAEAGAGPADDDDLLASLFGGGGNTGGGGGSGGL